LVSSQRDAASNFTSIIWIETLTSSVAMLQHALMQWILHQVPDLRKLHPIQYTPPTTVQEGQLLLQQMIRDAESIGSQFFYVLNECNNPFLPSELGLGLDDTFMVLTHSRIVADVCSRRIKMPPIKQHDILELMRSYEENISIIPILAGQTEEEEENLEADLIMDAYRLSVARKSNQGRAKSSKAIELAKEMERVSILVEISCYPLMATLAAGALRHAERWSKKDVKSSLENFLRRIERSVQEEHGIYVEDEITVDRSSVDIDAEVPRPTFGNIIDASLESIPHLVRLCLLDLVYIRGAPKGFPFKLAISLWSKRIGNGAPKSTGDLYAFLHFL
jgi:hypothetical protein